jgi:hypothetical protein
MTILTWLLVLLASFMHPGPELPVLVPPEFGNGMAGVAWRGDDGIAYFTGWYLNTDSSVRSFVIEEPHE